MQCMISKNNVKFTGDMAWMVESLLQHNAFVPILFKTMYNKTIVTFGFCDIRNNQSLIIPDITKISSMLKNMPCFCLILRSSLQYLISLSVSFSQHHYRDLIARMRCRSPTNHSRKQLCSVLRPWPDNLFSL